MKKMMHIFAVIAILLTGADAYAGSGRHVKPTDPAPEFTSNVKTSFKATKKVGGELQLTWWVVDVNMKPVAGALVSVPCTGQPAKYTDAKGMAVFSVGNVCPCNGDDATVTTQKGCYQQLKVSCGTYQVQCNQ